jgi:hypothetical protein
MCRDVVRRWSDYAILIERDANGLNVETGLARDQFEQVLQQLRSAHCQTLSDALAKCRVFAKLDACLDEDDVRLRGYSRDLLREIADLLQAMTKAASSEGEFVR